MSTKPASKAAKHSAQGHRGKKGETPDPHTTRGGDGSPTGSQTSEIGEGAGGSMTVHPIDAVLTGDEIQALRITDEKLQMLRSTVESPVSLHHPLPKQVTVRRTRAPEDVQSRKKRVAVLHPMPAGVSVQATRTLQLGQRVKRGDLSPHPVLGNIGELTTEQEECLTINESPKPHPSPRHTISYQDTIVPRERHALQYWEEAMEDRKLQQDYLSRKFRKSPERLAMNQGDSYRPKQEQRMKIDRAIPPLDYGKGYRVGSEFWSQTVQIGNTETGINTTLTRSEKGQPLPLELIETPHTVRVEKGTENADGSATLCHTWETTPYLLSRTQQLQSSLTQTAPEPTPDMDKLEVIGHAPHDITLDSLGEEESYSEDSLSGSEDITPPSNQMASQDMDVVQETFPQPLVGPGLKIRGHLLKWDGAPKPDLQTGYEPVDFRLTFESGVEEEVTSCLPMENCGTTAIYFSWTRLVQPNPLQTVQAGDTQRFYFDTRGGVLLPGQVLSFQFVFKSSNAGIFTEAWALETCPLLAGGQTIRVTLRGVAFKEDINERKREDLERELSHRVAVVAAERLINTIVNSIATPPHTSPQPLDTLPEEDVFKSQNPHLYYHYNVVLQLKALYDEILRPELAVDENVPPSMDSGQAKKEKGKQAPAGGGGGKKEKERGESGGQDKKAKAVKEEPSVAAEVQESSPKPVEKSVPDWDLSTDNLLQVVLGIEEDERREEKLKLLSDLLGQLSFPPPALPPSSSYSLVYQLVSEALEQVSASSQRLCKVMGLPQRESCPTKSSPSSAEDEQLPSTTSSSAVTNKKEKEKEKKGKKPDTKKAGSGRDKERAPSRGKSVAARKSKTSVSSKDTDTTSESPAEQTPAVVPVQQVDPLVEKKYRENFYASVYAILVATVEKMVFMLPE